MSKKYRTSDSVMLLTSEVITRQAVERIRELEELRPGWTPSFFDAHLLRIQRAHEEIVAMDNAHVMKEQTKRLHRAADKLIKDFALFNVFLLGDLGEERAVAVLEQLGYKQIYYARKRQPALLQMSFTLLSNIGALRAEIEAAGMAPMLIDTMLANAQEVHDANILQEQAKGNRKVMTRDDEAELNDIFVKSMAIAKGCAGIFKKDKALKSMFTWLVVQRGISTERRAGSRERVGESEERERVVEPAERQFSTAESLPDMDGTREPEVQAGDEAFVQETNKVWGRRIMRWWG